MALQKRHFCGLSRWRWWFRSFRIAFHILLFFCFSPYYTIKSNWYYCTPNNTAIFLIPTKIKIVITKLPILNNLNQKLCKDRNKINHAVLYHVNGKRAYFVSWWVDKFSKRSRGQQKYVYHISKVIYLTHYHFLNNINIHSYWSSPW